MLNPEPLVSVVIPTYNRSSIIGRTVETVLRQTYEPLEVIVVDDGSTDDTESVLGRFGSKIRLITQRNAGPAAARNRGIRESRGDIVTFLDSDDLWVPYCVEKHVHLLSRLPEDVPCSLANGWLHSADGRTTTSFQNSHLFPQCREGLCLNMPDILASRFVMFCQFIAIRRSALAQLQGFSENIRFMEDYDLPLRLALLGPWAFISEPLVTWQQGRAGSESVSQRALAQQKEVRESLLIIRKRYLEMIHEKPQFARSKELQLWELHLDQVELQAIELRTSGRKIMGDLLFKAVQYRKALYRRGPWYPKMKVAALDAP